MTSAELDKAMVDLWNKYNLDTHFTNEWSSGVGDFLVLNDQEAAPGNPMPYCVYEYDSSSVSARMTGEVAHEKQEFRNFPWMFIVYARQTTAESAKEVASRMANEIMKVFGGHHESVPDIPVLPEEQGGRFVQAQYQGDWGVRQDDEVYSWNISYELMIDAGVRV